MVKLATLKNASRDGQLVAVSRDLERYVPVPGIARNLQNALDNWATNAPKLQAISNTLNSGSNALNSGSNALNTRKQAAKKFTPKTCSSPLPRAYQWADGSAYVNHVELVRKARGAPLPDCFWSEPLIYQGGSDSFLGPHDPIFLANADWGLDFEAEIAVITDDVPQGISPADALPHIKLIMLVNDVSLRNLIPPELAKGFGFFQGKPSSSFSPTAITPDELGDHWQDGKLHLPLRSHLNDTLFGRPNAGQDMTFSFADLIAHSAKTRPLCAGTIIGSGTVSNKLDGGPGKPVADGGAGYSCIAEQRMIETIEHGAPITPFLQIGDSLKIEMHDTKGRDIFGTIFQNVSASPSS